MAFPRASQDRRGEDFLALPELAYLKNKSRDELLALQQTSQVELKRYEDGLRIAMTCLPKAASKPADRSLITVMTRIACAAHSGGLRLRLANPPRELTVAEQLVAGPEGREEGLSAPAQLVARQQSIRARLSFA